MATSRQRFVRRMARRPFYRTEACHVHGWIDCNFRLFIEKEWLCRLTLAVSTDDWSAATWLVPGACENGGNRDGLRRCPAWPVRDVPARGESTGQSGRGSAGRLGTANRAFAFAGD